MKTTIEVTDSISETELPEYFSQTKVFYVCRKRIGCFVVGSIGMRDGDCLIPLNTAAPANHISVIRIMTKSDSFQELYNKLND
jgi:hypothetical protein